MPTQGTWSWEGGWSGDRSAPAPTGPLPGPPGCPCPSSMGCQAGKGGVLLPGTVQPLAALDKGGMQMSQLISTLGSWGSSRAS